MVPGRWTAEEGKAWDARRWLPDQPAAPDGDPARAASTSRGGQRCRGGGLSERENFGGHKAEFFARQLGDLQRRLSASDRREAQVHEAVKGRLACSEAPAAGVATGNEVSERSGAEQREVAAPALGRSRAATREADEDTALRSRSATPRSSTGGPAEADPAAATGGANLPSFRGRSRVHANQVARRLCLLSRWRCALLARSRPRLRRRSRLGLLLGGQGVDA